jgi:hypothetical protein
MNWDEFGDRLGTRPDRSGQQDILLDQLAAAEKGSSWWRCDCHLARVIIIIMLGGPLLRRPALLGHLPEHHLVDR